HVVGVQMGEEDLLQLGEPDRRALQLPLRAFRAVEQEPLAPATEEERSGRAARGRHRCGRAQEHDVEVHAEESRVVAESPSRCEAGPPSRTRDSLRGMAADAILELYRREVTPELYAEIRELYKRHSIA